MCERASSPKRRKWSRAVIKWNGMAASESMSCNLRTGENKIGVTDSCIGTSPSRLRRKTE